MNNNVQPAIADYYEILQAGADALDVARLRSVFADDLDYEGPITGTRVGADAFVEGAARFAKASRGIQMLHLIGAGAEAAALYDAELPGGTVRFAEFFEVGAGKIRSLRLLFDAEEFRTKSRPV